MKNRRLTVLATTGPLMPRPIEATHRTRVGQGGLRHTAGTTLTRSGVDLVLVAEILGHSVETARRYALPTREDRQAAIERLTRDE